ncbi:MAG: 4-hydroxybenzoate octaprenyltransferase [Pseudomonadota bacterium]
MEALPVNKVEIGGQGVADAVPLNWVDRTAPAAWRPYLRLSRADRPIGTWLLLLPCWWGLSLAAISSGWRWIDLWLYIACTVGAFLMRGAGCTWNDIQDRVIDASVERTRARPLAAGQVTLRQATIWMVVQALAAFLILLTFNWNAIWLGIIACIPVAIYPFAKRFTWWPQFFLGIAFNWGALLMWVAHTGSIAVAPIYLYIAGIAWTLHYDTIYAHQDREDDALIGVRSTARLFGEETQSWLLFFVAIAAMFAFLAVFLAGAGLLAVGGVLGFGLHMMWQIRNLDIDDPEVCLFLFRATRWGGLILFLGLFLDAMI